MAFSMDTLMKRGLPQDSDEHKLRERASIGGSDVLKKREGKKFKRDKKLAYDFDDIYGKGSSRQNSPLSVDRSTRINITIRRSNPSDIGIGSNHRSISLLLWWLLSENEAGPAGDKDKTSEKHCWKLELDKVGWFSCWELDEVVCTKRSCALRVRVGIRGWRWRWKISKDDERERERGKTKEGKSRAPLLICYFPSQNFLLATSTLDLRHPR